MEKLSDYLEEFITENKKDLIDKVIDKRTNHLALVLEDIYQPQNGSATIRTSECLGIQNIHIIENWNKYKVNTAVVMGASKWLDLHRYNTEEDIESNTFNGSNKNTEACFKKLKADGYKIVATTLSDKSVSLDEIDLNTKTALVFGCEEYGVSNYAFEYADEHMKIPMHGFTQSYNISVSVAIAFSHLINKLHSSDINWQLSDEEKEELKLSWYKKIVKRSDLYEEFYDRNKLAIKQ